MKKRLIFNTLFVLVFTASVFQSCSKEGPTGPAGTANVLFSDWFTPGSYVKTTVYGISNFTYLKDSISAITSAVMDSGVVLVYGKLLGYTSSIWPSNLISQLPISLTYQSGSTMTDTWTALVNKNQIKITFVNNLNYYSSISNSHKFRYIILPGGTSLKSKSKKLRVEDYKEMSYEQVCKMYNIPE